MATNKWKIDTWDAGWYQIRRCLTEHNLATDELKELSKANEQLAEQDFTTNRRVRLLGQRRSI
jgi:hypothetical protein